MPWRDTRPMVGLSPVSPCCDDGLVMDPPVWVPVLDAAMRAATDVADPEDEPPGSTVGSPGAHALRVVRTPSGVVALVVAKGPIWVLPRRMAPPSWSRAQDVASYSGT